MWAVYVGVPLMCLMLFCGGLWWFRKGLAHMRHAQDTPTSKIRSAAQGYVELEGIAKPIEGQALLLAELTGTPCLWWSYDIQVYKYEKNRQGWETIESGSSKGWLCLADNTGQCRINPQGARIVGHEKKVWKGRTRDPRKPDQRNALSKSFSRRYRYIESVLLPERELYALGDFKSSDGEHLLEKPVDGRPFILSGKGEAGAITDSRKDTLIGAAFILMGVVGAALGLWFLW